MDSTKLSREDVKSIVIVYAAYSRSMVACRLVFRRYDWTSHQFTTAESHQTVSANLVSTALQQERKITGGNAVDDYGML